MSEHQTITRRAAINAKRLAVTAAAAVAVIWIGGSTLALLGASFPPGTCRAPYNAWAMTWPVWFVAPDGMLLWTQHWAMEMCD